MIGSRSLLVRLLFAISSFVLASSVYAEVKLPAIIGNNMVLQQGVKVRIWGWAEPGEKVKVSMKANSAESSADRDGKWQVWLGPFSAGGAYEMRIAGKNEIALKNILVGEVWIASGQSNMEFHLQNAAHGGEEVSRASHPEIRLFSVAKATSLEPRDYVVGRWVVCSPENAGSFSAVAYFFGRDVQQELRVPVGLIHTSWGGTPAEAWTRRGALAAIPELKPMIDLLDHAAQDLPAALREYQAAEAKWEKEHYLQDPGNKGFELGYARPDFTDEDWKAMRVPQTWESAGLAIDGSVWFRRSVDLPAEWAGKDLTLSLGAIDDFDTTYFNGTRVGAIGEETPNFWTVPREYTIPGSLVRGGRNVIAVRVFDHFGDGGFAGASGQMSISAPGAQGISLAGDWRYKIEKAFEPIKVDFSTQPAAPAGVGNPNTPTVLYNAMIAPIAPYTIRGAIWYQGESNAGRARQYRVLFPTMIRDWRAVWGEGGFPFLFVQLANWQPRKAEPSDSDWAALREAQMMTLSEPATGMAVTIDIGEANDIHPKNKQEVGRRLALWALAKTYGRSIEFSGPLYQSFSIERDKIRVKFTHAKGLSTRGGAEIEGFAVAGADGKFVWANAKIDGEGVVVWSDSVKQPKAARYAWADNPAANLYNGAGLPASPFRTDRP